MAVQKSKQRMWAANGRWANWVSSDYRRRITNAKPGELVHHIDHNKKDNKKSNFEVLKPTKTMNAIWVHNSRHPEKEVKGGKARGKQLKK